MRTRFSSQYRLLLTLGLLLVLLVPSDLAGFLPGLPLDPLATTLLVILTFAVWVGRGEWLHRFRQILTGMLVLLLAGQLLATTKSSTGWNICLKGEVRITPLQTACETTGQFPHGEQSYRVPALSFDREHIPLFFFNRAPFGYSHTNLNRYHLPYNLTAQAYFWAQEGDGITITSDVPYTQIKINGKAVTLGKSLESRFPLTPGQLNEVEIKYAVWNQVEDAFRVETDSLPHFRLVSRAHDQAAEIYALGRSALLGIIAGLILVDLLATVLAYAPRPRLFIGLAAGTLLGLLIMQPVQQLTLPLTAAALVALTAYSLGLDGGSRRQLGPWIILALFLLCLAFISYTNPHGRLMIWPGEADTFTHTDHGYAVLTGTNWNDFLTGGEDELYYYQPLYRYFVAFAAKLFGESVWGLYLMQSFLLSVGIYSLAHALKRFVGSAGAYIWLGITLVFSGFIGTASLFNLMSNVYQQALGLALLLLVTARALHLLAEKSWRPAQFLTLGLLIGLTFGVRTDYLIVLPFLLWPLLYHVGRQAKKKRWSLWGPLLATFAIFPLLILYRNVAVTGTARLMPTSILVNLLPELQKVFDYSGRGATDLSFGQVIFKILRGYADHPVDLLQILSHNIYNSVILQVAVGWRSVLWLLTLGGLAATRRRVAAPLSTALWSITAGLLAALAVHSFIWFHLEYGMIALFDLLVMLICSLTWGFWLTQGGANRIRDWIRHTLLRNAS